MIEVLLVDDEPLTLEAHREYVGRVPGFRVAAEANGARAALDRLAPPRDGAESGPGIDLVLLDMTMPDGTGLDVLRYARAMQTPVDVIALTSVRDPETVRRVIMLGAVQYLVKPFTFAALRERLEQYRDFRERALDASGAATQSEIDAMFGALRPAPTGELPKGLSAQSLDAVLEVMRSQGSVTAADAAERAGMSRVTARRYLEYLAEQGRIDRAAKYGTGGRPQSEYRWRTT
ncbi:response regulator [Gulosibacter faecalis]|uniref:Transcriptional regulatory protein n=1 Tax=Gulosibacter faecalis TaxID=272240 RepID=A0ABW5UXB1_9MICO|nr:response regulator [Gulosibacter faecalis]